MSTFRALLQFGQQNAMQFHSEPFAVEMPVTVSCRTWVNVRAQWGQIAMFAFRHEWPSEQYGAGLLEGASAHPHLPVE